MSGLIRLSAATVAAMAMAVPGQAFGAAGLDRGFGHAGAASLPYEHAAFEPGGLAVAASGAVTVVASPIVEADPNPRGVGLVARYRPNGTPDRRFGRRGVVTLPVGTGYLRSVALVGRGRVVVAGAGGTSLLDAGKPLVAVLRSDGSADAAFGSGGVFAAGTSGPGTLFGAWAVARAPGGKIVAAGSGLRDAGHEDVFVVRLLRDGTLDPAFGGGGVAWVSFGPGLASEYATGLFVRRDGRVTVSGAEGFDEVDGWGVARLRSDGRPDPTFSDDGVAEVAMSSMPAGLAPSPHGGTVVAGSSGGRVRLVRFDARGVVDRRYGSGWSTGLRGPVALSGLAADVHGRVLVCGAGLTRRGLVGGFLMRFDRRGRLDPAFGPRGRAHGRDLPGVPRLVAAGGHDRVLVVGDGGIARFRAP